VLSSIQHKIQNEVRYQLHFRGVAQKQIYNMDIRKIWLNNRDHLQQIQRDEEEKTEGVNKKAAGLELANQ